MVQLPPTPASAQTARRVASEALLALERPELLDDVAAVVSELVANAVVHARTELELSVQPAGAGVRVEVSDGSAIIPRWAPARVTATSGRGLIMVQRLSSAWGVEPRAGGKTVWALIEQPADQAQDASFEDLLALWSADQPEPARSPGAVVQVVLTVDVAQMLDSRAHTADLARELQLLVYGDTTDPESAPVVQLANRLASATEAFHEVRHQILQQTLSAAQRGHTEVTLDLLLHRADADAARAWLDALDQADALTDTGVLLLPPFPPGMVEFRRHYISSIITRLEETDRRT